MIKMVDFGEGDKVRCIDASNEHGPTGEFLIESEIYEITKMGSECILELDGDISYPGLASFATIRFEKVTEGSEMDDVDGIGFKITNNNLRHALVNELKSNDIKIFESAKTDEYLGQYYGLSHKIDDKHFECLGSKDYVEEYCDKILEFPEDWDTIMEFYGVDTNEPPEVTIGGDTVEFKSDEIEVGCKDISNDTLREIQEFRESMDNKSLHIGTMEIRGRDVTETQLNDIVGYQLPEYERTEVPF